MLGGTATRVQLQEAWLDGAWLGRGAIREDMVKSGVRRVGTLWAQPRTRAGPSWLTETTRPLLPLVLLALLAVVARGADAPARLPASWGRVTRQNGLGALDWRQEGRGVPAALSASEADDGAASSAGAAAAAKGTATAAAEGSEAPRPRLRIHPVRKARPVTSIHDRRLAPSSQASAWTGERRSLVRYQGSFQRLSGDDGEGDSYGGRGRPESPPQAGNASGAPAPSVPPAPSPPQTLLPWAGLSEGHEAGPIAYHGGPVLSDPLTVYFIYYGNWTQGGEQVVFEQFVRALSDPSVDGQKVPTVHQWWELATMYTEEKKGVRVPVSRQVRVGPSVTINSGYRVHLGDGLGGQSGDVADLVLYLVGRGDLPLDRRGFYAVLTSGDITVGAPHGGFCKAYCGFHSYATTPKQERLIYGFVGDATTKCSSACAGNLGKKMTANGYYRADSMIDTLAHELIEAATNPDVSSAWWALDQDGVGQHEVADLCSSVYVDGAHPDVLSNRILSYKYNLQGPNGFRFLVQTVVDGRTQTCALSSRTAEMGMQGLPASRRAQPPTLVSLGFRHLLLPFGLLLLLR